MPAAHPRLHHLNIKTRKLQTMVDWYRLVTGARVVFQNEIAAWLTNDEANHRLAFLAPPTLEDDPDKRHRTGMHHCAFEFSNFDDLANSYERLRTAGIMPKACLDHGMTFSMYYPDPDGNLVELQCDVFGDWRMSTEWMEKTLPFQANPIGIYFDPEAAISAYRRGVTFERIRERLADGEFGTRGVDDLGIDL